MSMNLVTMVAITLVVMLASAVAIIIYLITLAAHEVCKFLEGGNSGKSSGSKKLL